MPRAQAEYEAVKKIISRLKELQKTPVRSTIQDDLRLIRSDRDR